MLNRAATITLIVAMCVVTGRVVEADTIFNDLASGNSHVGDPGNWDNGLPTATNWGTIGGDHAATYENENDFNQLLLIVSENSKVTGGSANISGSTIYVGDEAEWTSTGGGLTLGGDAALGGSSTFLVYGNATVTLAELAVGRETGSRFYHYGGDVYVSGTLTIGSGAKSDHSTYDLLAGTLTYDGLLVVNDGGQFNFPEHSNGTVNLINDYTDIDDVIELINTGKITYGSEPSDLSLFSINEVEIEGEIYTEVRLVPEPTSLVMLLGFLGLLLVGYRVRRIWAP